MRERADVRADARASDWLIGSGGESGCTRADARVDARDHVICLSQSDVH